MLLWWGWEWGEIWDVLVTENWGWVMMILMVNNGCGWRWWYTMRYGSLRYENGLVLRWCRSGGRKEMDELGKGWLVGCDFALF